MKFKELAARLKHILPGLGVYYPEFVSGTDDPEICVIISDSRRVVPGSIFACVSGEHHDGHEFASQAAASGAVALLCERRLEVPLPQIICPGDMRREMGSVAAVLYENPASKLTMIALTGTNGKTTSTFMTKSILEKNGVRTGLLGTVYNIDGSVCEDAEHTTPEGSDLQTWLYRMVQNGCRACVMETSSHAIHQGRIDGLKFDRAGFTNLTVEHLDYHIDMENYFAAKHLLFDNYMRGDWRAAVNLDDAYGRRLYDEYRDRSCGYSMENTNAEFFASVKSQTVEGTYVAMTFPDKTAVTFRLPMIGAYNVSNALQAASLAWSLGIPADLCAEGLGGMSQVPGRLERYLIDGQGTCVIDFAHSPDGLDKVLTALRPVCKGRLIVAFGAGGDRDNSKRPLMGAVAAKLADYVIITSDNPRSEDPMRITLQVEEGAKKHPSTPRTVIVDRREAIFAGIDMLETDDILVIAGKGPERYQILKNETIPFLDKDQVMDWCRINGKEVI